VPALERLIAVEPFRERFRAQYVLALYRAGRQKDALDAHRAARAMLVDELGVDPGPELQELERRILRHDPALAPPEARTPGRLQLPTPPTPLVGRRLEVAAVTALLRRQDVRLVTLIGPGGTGKTRLALAAAEELGRNLRDGAVFVDVAPIRDSALLGPTIAHSLGVAEGPSAERAVEEHLRDRSVLLLLDNLEQLGPNVRLIGRLLSSAPRLLVLATSRSPLRLLAEHAYPVPPLAPPRRSHGSSFEELAGNDGVRLFVARARAVDPTFELSDENIDAVRRVCERLDGLPLAIELAAARTRLLTPETMSRRFDEGLDLLTGGAADLPARHQTLRSTLEWSHDLLEAAERILFARLAVFVGGWTLEAAEAVCGDGTFNVLETLASLVEKNLLRRLQRPGEPRFAMLETIREYAIEQLDQSGEQESCGQAHAQHVLELAEELAPRLLAGEETAFGRFDDEHDNLRAAILWFAETGDVVSEVRALDATWNYLNVRCHLTETRWMLESAIERAGGGAPLRTQGLARIHAAAFAYRQGDAQRAKELSEQALPIFREIGDTNEIGRCIGTLGNVAVAQGDLDRAVELYEEAAALARETGNTGRLATILANLGSIAGLQDDAETSARYAKEASDLQRELGEQDGLAVSLHNLGRCELDLGRLADARRSLAESLAIARALGYREVIAYCLSGMAELALIEDENERAAEFLGASEALFREIGAAIEAGEADAQRLMLSQLYDVLGEERADELRQIGAARSVDELIAV
jgi:predicted ATPase/Tfp pilus assembly protein PilF